MTQEKGNMKTLEKILQQTRQSGRKPGVEIPDDILEVAVACIFGKVSVCSVSNVLYGSNTRTPQTSWQLIKALREGVAKGKIKVEIVGGG